MSHKCAACGNIHLSFQCPVCDCYEVRPLSDNSPLIKRTDRPMQPLRRSSPPLRNGHKPANAANPLRKRLTPITVDAEGNKAD